jgi:hypothetical protein
MGPKALSDITREEWITINWVEVTKVGDQDRMFVENFKRTPEEAAKAKDDWDYTLPERQGLFNSQKSRKGVN